MQCFLRVCRHHASTSLAVRVAGAGGALVVQAALVPAFLRNTILLSTISIFLVSGLTYVYPYVINSALHVDVVLLNAIKDKHEIFKLLSK